MNDETSGNLGPMAPKLLDSNMSGQRATLSEHLVQIPGGEEWALWRTVCLRGAGFPAHHVLKLATPESGAAADRLLDAEIEFDRVRRQALDALWNEFRKGSQDEAPQIDKAIRRLSKNKLPRSFESSAPITEGLQEFERASVLLDSTREKFRHTYSESLIKASQAIREVAQMDRFREAVTWQNRQALQTGINALLRRMPGDYSRESKHRQHEELVANYLQRYCVKNDTIGFFGPIGWGRITPDRKGLLVEPGLSLLDSRNVYFESWCIESLALKLSRDKELFPWTTPSRAPFIRLEGRELFVLSQFTKRLSIREAAILHACDNNRTAKEVAALVLRVPQIELRSEAEVYSILDRLSKAGLVSCSFKAPVEAHAENKLRMQLELIDDPGIRRRALRPLTELEERRLDIAQAAGDPVKLDQCLLDMEVTFSRLTNATSTKSAGKMYAGRTLVYEDCRRDIKAEIGSDIIEALGSPLSLLLASARWLTAEIADAYRVKFKELYSNLVSRSNSPLVDCTEFWIAALPMLRQECVNDVVLKFQERWQSILNVSLGDTHIQLSSKEIRPKVVTAFKAQKPGWKGALHHSPDVMIAAPSMEAVRRGDYELVLGEMHVAANTLGATLFMMQHPHPEEFYAAIELDHPERRLLPIPPRNWQNLTTRTVHSLFSPKDIRVETSEDNCVYPKTNTLPIASFVVEQKEDQLIMRTRDNRLSFEIIEAFGEMMIMVAVDCFKILAPGCHTPRVMIDRLVVSREAWSIPAGELIFSSAKDEADRFLAARRWMRSHGMPRFVFVRVPVEVKPFYVDFESPVYVNIFAKMVRRTLERCPADALISVAEMLPDANHAWLPDADGRYYTSEFRLVAVDLLSE